MAKVSTYLIFRRSTESAFLFYRSVFESEFLCPIHRFSDTPSQENQPPVAEEDRNLVMHVALPILGGHILMGSDCPDSGKFPLEPGNNVCINLEPDSRAEADRLFAALSRDGSVKTPMQEMFWGAYFGALIDPFGIHWMINCESKT
ncbi:VOC family protein [Paludibacterium paludis]|nr:VOC family protein [Paludibacterium paludis]